MSKIYQYHTWDYLGYENVRDITEGEIIDRYWNFWKKKMTEIHGNDYDGITMENCIHDWIKENWAWEKKDLIK